LNYPKLQILLTSYSDDYANKYGRIARNLINDYGTYFNIEINKDNRESKLLSIKDYGGQMLSSGYNGQITGQGADWLIIDDPVKNGSEALSETYRNKIYERYKDTLYTRLHPNGKVIIVMTRWHEDDLAGRLLKNFPDDYEYINLPALADENDILGRKEGEALWEKRYNKETLHKIRTLVGGYYWNALYQQKPSSKQDSFFAVDKLQYIRFSNGIIFKDGTEISVANMYRFFTIDLATAIGKDNDNTCISYFAFDGLDLYLLDTYYGKVDADKHFELIGQYFEMYKPNTICVETVQYQVVLFQELKKRGYIVEELKPSKNKVIRAMPSATKINNGQIYFNANIKYINEIENEMLYFPYGKHDDFIDTLSYAVEKTIKINFGNYNDTAILSESINDNATKAIQANYGLDDFNSIANNYY